MLSSLSLENFTVFSNATLEFSQGVNVILGENGTGKSHLLKIAHVVNHFFGADADLPKDKIERDVAEKLQGVFKPDFLGRLATRRQGKARCTVAAQTPSGDKLTFHFATNSSSRVSVDSEGWVRTHEEQPSLLLPPKEVLSIYPGFTALYRDRVLEFDETYADLCADLDRPPLRGRRYDDVSRLLQPFTDLLQGSIEKHPKSGRFYFRNARGFLEINLLAEGYRKLGMLMYLVLNGSLMDRGMLLWDEPESNLNPRLIRGVADVLSIMAEHGIQVVVATHSLFLLRELEMQARRQNVKMECISLQLDSSMLADVSQADNLLDLPVPAALEEEAEQSDRYLSEMV